MILESLLIFGVPVLAVIFCLVLIRNFLWSRNLEAWKRKEAIQTEAFMEDWKLLAHQLSKEHVDLRFASRSLLRALGYPTSRAIDISVLIARLETVAVLKHQERCANEKDDAAL